MKKSIFLVLSMVLTLASCTSGNVFEYTIASQEVDCMGVAPQKCLLVKKGAETDWQYFYSSIEGFTYEPNYEYKLTVREEKIDNPPMDASAVKYTLVKQLEKVKKTSENLPAAVVQNKQTVYQCTAKVLAVEKETIGRGAATGKMEVVVVKLEVTSSASDAIQTGSIIHAELIASPTVMPEANREYVFKAKDLHPAHAKGVYLLDTDVMDLIH